MWRSFTHTQPGFIHVLPYLHQVWVMEVSLKWTPTEICCVIKKTHTQSCRSFQQPYVYRLSKTHLHGFLEKHLVVWWSQTAQQMGSKRRIWEYQSDWYEVIYMVLESLSLLKRFIVVTRYRTKLSFCLLLTHNVCLDAAICGQTDTAIMCQCVRAFGCVH